MDTVPESKDGLSSTIKVLTIIKLILQIAFYGVLLGATIWFLVNNPLPGLVKDVQTQLMGSFGL